MTSTLAKDVYFERIAILRDIPLFAELNDDDWHTVVNDCQLREYARNDIIFHQGDASYKFYIIGSSREASSTLVETSTS